MTECLLLLWNTAWIEGVFLSDWKKEKRTVIAKLDKEDFHHANSYRTVSVTAVLGKRFEKITCRRIMAILEEQGFDEAQFAYMDARSTTQALLTVIETIQLGISEGKECGAIFFDLTDAFGSVNRVKLVEKLRNDFGIKGRLLSHVIDFLCNRKAQLKIGNLTGEWVGTDKGTSAGTILGPILFISYTHDVPKVIKPKFADDFTGLVVKESLRMVEETLQNHADQVSEWARVNEMEVNNKTVVMTFGNSQVRLNIYLNGRMIEQVNAKKYVGVWIDSQLSFEKQADYICGKARAALNKVMILFNGRRGLSLKIGIEAYKALVRTHLEFGIPAWAYKLTKYEQQISAVQYQSLRAISGAFMKSSSRALEVIMGVMPIDIRMKELC